MRTLLIVFLLASCTMPSSMLAEDKIFLPTVTQQAQPDLQPATDAALLFLRNQYNDEYGLLQESLNIGKHRYYLTNDNYLANRVLHLHGVTDLAHKLDASLMKYQVDGNGFAEVAFGKVVQWPPFHHIDQVVEQHGDDQILFEAHDGPGYFSDWSGFSNLACMGIVNEINAGNRQSAQRLYEMQMSTFDGHGWADLAYQRRDGVYETLGLAWCLYAGALLKQPNIQVLDQLLAQQGELGGFHTHYSADENQLADPNIETTSIALLALWALENGPPTRIQFVE